MTTDDFPCCSAGEHAISPAVTCRCGGGGSAETVHDLRGCYDLPTPPADDVREALAMTLFRREYDKAPDRWIESAWAVATTRSEYLAVADAILAAFEVRPHRQSTPPANDVREALIDAMIDVEVSGGMVEFGKDDRAEAAYLADAILAAPGIEVRPRGTVTDADALQALAKFYELDGSPESHGWPEDTVRRMRSLLQGVRS